MWQLISFQFSIFSIQQILLNCLVMLSVFILPQLAFKSRIAQRLWTVNPAFYTFLLAISYTLTLTSTFELLHWAEARKIIIIFFIFMYSNNFFFRSSESSLPWGAMLNFQSPVWESESDNTKLNTPAPRSHPRPCNTNESHDTGERKWLIGPNLDIFT